MGPRDREDLQKLVDRIRAIEQTDGRKAPVCQELREKLQRCLTNGWLPESVPLVGLNAANVSARG